MTLDDDGPPLTGALSEARKEQIKRRATFLNGLGMV